MYVQSYTSLFPLYEDTEGVRKGKYPSHFTKTTYVSVNQ